MGHMAKRATTPLDEHSPIPLRTQLAALLRDAISDGAFGPGDKLPTVRELAERYAVGKTTAAGAVETLVKEGLLVARPHRGISVAARPGERKRHRVLTKQIGVVLGGKDDLAHDPYYVSLLSSAQHTASRYGQTIVLLRDGARADGRAPFLKLVAERRLDGVIYIVADKIDRAIGEVIRKAHLPLVTVDYAPTRPRFDAIMIDNTKGATAAMHRLVKLGHRRIAYLAPPGRAPSVSAVERHGAYRDVLEEAGVPYDPGLVRHEEVKVAGGARAMRALLSRSPTAVFSFCDYLSLGAMQAVEDAGMTVPRDFSAIGFGDQAAPLGLARPLSSVVIDTQEMGRAAVARLHERIEGYTGKPEIVRVDSTFVDRATTARAPSRARAG